MQHNTVQYIGWYGVVAILLAYVLLNFRILPADNLWYLLLNMTGAIAIVIEATSKHDRQPMVLNIIWAAVALMALGQLWLR